MNARNCTLSVIALVTLSALPLNQSPAADRGWIGLGGGFWSFPLNWSPPGAPLASDTIIIAPTRAVLDRDDTIAELQIVDDGILDTNGFQLTVNGPTSLVGNEDSFFAPRIDIEGGAATTDFATDSLVALAGSEIILRGATIEVDDGLLMLDQTSEMTISAGSTINLTQATSGLVFDNHGQVTADRPLTINSTGGGQLRLANPNGTFEVGTNLNQRNNIVISGDATAGVHLLEGRLEFGNAVTVTMDESLLVNDGQIAFAGDFAPDFVGPGVDVTQGFIFGEDGRGVIRAPVHMMGNSVIGAFPSGSLEFTEPVEFTGSGNVVDNVGNILFNGGVIVGDDSVSKFDVSSQVFINDSDGDGSTTSTFGDTHFTGSGRLLWHECIVVDGNVVIDSDEFIWGRNGGQTVINSNKTLTINASRLLYDFEPNEYRGTLTLGANSILNVNTDTPWELVGSIEMQNATINGANLSVGRNDAVGTITVSNGNSNRISPPVTFHGMAVLNVSDGSTLILQDEANFEAGSTNTIDGTLRLQGFTRFRGGTFTGSGTIDQNGDARFIEDTSINLDPETGIYNMDGLGGQSASILVNPNKAVTITANRINTANNIFSGEMTIDSGSMAIFTTDPWTMRGSLTMLRQPLADVPMLEGSTVIIEGTLSANGDIHHIDAAVTFADSAEVIVPTGDLLLKGFRNEFHGGSFTGDGLIRPISETVIVQPTTIETRVFDLDGLSDNATTVLPEAHLILDVGNIDDIDGPTVPQFDGNLALFGGDLTIQQSDIDRWATSSLSTFTMDAQIATPDLNGQPVTLQGMVNVVNGLSRINVPAVLQTDPNASPNVGVQTVTVTVAAGAELEFNETVDIDGGVFDGEGTITFNKSTSINGPVNADLGGIRIGQLGDIEMTGGDVAVANFTKQSGASFSLRDGTFTVRGGDAEFNSSFSFGGPSANEHPIFRVEQGADASVTFSFQIAPAAGQFATAVVTGTDGARRSTVRGTGGGAGADLIVGGAGDGSLVVSAGGLVDLRDDLVIGRDAGSLGEVNVRDVENGFRATIDVTARSDSSIQIGGGDGGGAGVGVLNIENGGFVQTSADVTLARFVGAEAFLNVRGQAQGFPAELDVADDIFVGGTGSAPGGTAFVSIDDGGLVRADEMIIWQLGTVTMEGGDLFLRRLDLETGGGEFALLGGILHAADIVGNIDNQGATIDPGGSPGTMTISGDYTQGPNGTLRIELGGTMPGDEYDQLQVGGIATLGGTLAVELYDDGSGAFAPSAGDSFEVLTAAGGIVGTFDVLNLPDIGNSLLQEVNYLPNSVTIDYTQLALLAGDFDNSGGVEQADLDLVLLNWGESATPTPDGWMNDLPSGNVDQDELDKVLLNWGITAAAVSGASGVPEPNAMLLFVASALAVYQLIHMRRRVARQ